VVVKESVIEKASPKKRKTSPRRLQIKGKILTSNFLSAWFAMLEAEK
jgi:hypothetical protein